MTETDGLWTGCTAALRSQVTEATWQMWLSELQPLDYSAGVLTLAAPSPSVRHRVESRFLPMIEGSLAEVAGEPVAVVLQVAAPADGSATLTSLAGAGGAGSGPTTPQPGDHGPNSAPVPDDSVPATRARRGSGSATPTVALEPRFTFESFVAASSNRLAHAAAQAVAETPGRSYNPLFIYGDSGLGKTHLLHAIGNYVTENFSTRRVLYVTTETFLNDFVDSLRLSTTIAFKRRYRDCDVLLIDDVQFMENKEGLQEEFFHTYNDLKAANKQIVLTSDRPPKSIETLEDRLRSRFNSGLLTEIDPPDLETRLAILRSKAEAEHFAVPHDVLEFIASHVKNNIRELEGALLQVTAYGTLNAEPVTLHLAEKVLSDIVSGEAQQHITPQMILDATAASYGFSVDAICGPSRTRPLVTARQVAMYLVRQLTDYSYPAIARVFGGRDHTTVIHAVDKISKQMKERRQVYDQVTDLMRQVKSTGSPVPGSNAAAGLVPGGPAPGPPPR